jgi:hypothetical protein
MFTDRLLANIATASAGIQVADRSAPQYIPMFFHLVGNADGSGRARERDIFNQLCVLNQAFAPMEMRFYLKPHPTYGLFGYSINQDDVFNNQNNTAVMQSRRHQTALNIYVVNQAGAGTGSGTTLAYFSPSNDWIVSRKDQITGPNDNGTLAHEIGHFFSLRHTFYGWEEDAQDPDQPPCFDANDPGWPIAPTFAPFKPGGNTILTEFQDGSNCNNAADLICDTPPDYNFGFCQNGCNTYNGGARDPKGELVRPMENNYMSYFTNCDYEFTTQQQSIMLADRQTATRSYLNNNFVPSALAINTPADLLTNPPNGITTEFANIVKLEWQPVEGATYYLLEVDRINSYSTIAFQSHVVTGTSKMISGLEGNRQYFWRVRPLNEYATCAQARQRNFRTSTLIADEEPDSTLVVRIVPNPVLANLSAGLFVSTPEAFEANIHIFDVTGRQMRSLNSVAFPKGETTYQLPVDGLAHGLYFVVVENDARRSVSRMTILK